MLSLSLSLSLSISLSLSLFQAAEQPRFEGTEPKWSEIADIQALLREPHNSLQ